jgi:Helix-turn-helix domain/RodZ C-terminal domain
MATRLRAPSTVGGIAPGQDGAEEVRVARFEDHLVGLILSHAARAPPERDRSPDDDEVLARPSTAGVCPGQRAENDPVSTFFPPVPGVFPQRRPQSTQVFQIGDSLREARTRRGLSPADVHRAIRIRERYLTALEEERWDMLPGEAYTKGFLRTYAEFLGLQGNLYIDEYNARIARHDEEHPPLVAHPSVERHRFFQGGVLVTLAGVLVLGAAVAGLAAWRLGGSSTPPRPAARAQPSGGSSVASAPTSTQTAPPRHVKPSVPVRPTFARIVAARGRCWLLVRAGGPSGAILYEGILEQGQSKRFQIRSHLWVRMGRPNALDITVAGRAVTPLGGTPSNLVLART